MCVASGVWRVRAVCVSLSHRLECHSVTGSLTLSFTGSRSHRFIVESHINLTSIKHGVAASGRCQSVAGSGSLFPVLTALNLEASCWPLLAALREDGD